MYADECGKQPSTSITQKQQRQTNHTNAQTNNEWTFLTLDILCFQSFNFLDSCMIFWFNIWIMLIVSPVWFSFVFPFHLFHHHLTSFGQFEIFYGKYFLILYLFFKNRLKGKPHYRRSTLVLKPKDGESESSKFMFSSISFHCFPLYELIIVILKKERKHIYQSMLSSDWLINQVVRWTIMLVVFVLAPNLVIVLLRERS